MFTTLTAEFLEFQPGGRGLLVLGGGVVAVFALSTLQRNNLSRHLNLPFRLLRRLDREALSASKRGNQRDADCAAPRREKSNLRNNLADSPGAHGASAFANCEPQALFHRHWRDQ